MLLELDVRDFAIIDHLQLGLKPGFNVVTGETGAGKSIVIDAVGLLLGDRADTSFIRAGAERAVITGLFDLGSDAARLAPLFEAYGIQVDPGEPLIALRELHAAGRSLARINGQAVPVRALSELGERLIAIHGQSDNAALKREAEHLGLLDRFAGLEAPRAALAVEVQRLREVERRLKALQQDEDALRRRIDYLSFAVEEIAAARFRPDEEATLKSERLRLANGEKLALAAEQAHAALSGEMDPEVDLSGLDLIDRAVRAAEDLARIDLDCAPMLETLAGAAEALRDAAAQLRDYRESLDFSADRIEEVEERLALIAALERKHGVADIAGLLGFAEAAAAELAEMDDSEQLILQLGRQREALLAEIGLQAGALSAKRREAGRRLAQAVVAQLDELGMAGSRFEMAFAARALAEGGVPISGEGFESAARYAFDETGVDQLAFLVSMNPGEPPRALAKVASGGETARLMLAIKSILGKADAVPTLIFDEIDAGIGGRVGSVVGQKLWGLAAEHQVICVTHLPQVAAFGDAHYRVAKQIAGGRTTTLVAPIEAGERVDELMQMLGAESSIARQNALQMLQQCEQWKLAAGAVAAG
jgi:DNA repair protein RecN (Recombination protein N)